MSICKECNNEFTKKSYQQEYCCNQCKIVASRKRSLERKHEERLKEFENNKISKCPVCKKEFEKQFCSTWRQQIYCSSSCRRRAESLIGNKKELGEQYKDKIRFDGNKQHVLIRDSFQCQFCNIDKQLIIHHLDGSGNNEQPNNDMDNLVTLCKSCHGRLHNYINKFNNN
jgi:hypothetical protein